MRPYNNKGNNPNNAIYINPNFKGQLPAQKTNTLQTGSFIPINAHINPLFLETRKRVNTIHMNPAFLHKFQQNPQQALEDVAVPERTSKSDLVFQRTDIALNPLCEKSEVTETRKIICKSKNRLIREPLVANYDNTPRQTTTSCSLQPLLVLNKRKLVRKAPVMSENFNKLKSVSCSDSRRSITRYKLDNRIRKKPLLPPTPRIKRTSFVGQYALKRTSLHECSNTKAKRSLPINKNNKKLQVLNINGLLYKSTRNTLTLKETHKSKPSTSNTLKEKTTAQGLTIFVRGHKYVMDANKFKLTRLANFDRSSSNYMASNNSFKFSTCKRIDIGGYTYVSTNSAKNVLIRTTNHLSRAYVHNAKQKSLQMLKKNLVKTNIPCPIFQRIGKCAAFERGKCCKVHNKLQVAICNKFLRGECLISNCLMSHNISLSKMPVCKFFLQGVCVRNDCPYLHKKLSETAELCTDFLRGFCGMADKCNKRHEFVCPEIERNNKCTTLNCVYCKAKRRKDMQIGKKSAKLKDKESVAASKQLSVGEIAELTENQYCKRYFVDSCYKDMEIASEKNYQNNEHNTNEVGVVDSSVENIEKNKTRPKLGTLPAYIPL